jgi:predicted nucleic acid-binding protein
LILADTSAWIEYDRATGSRVDLRMTELIGDGGPLVVTEPVIMEITAGARTVDREQLLRRLLNRFDLLRFEASVDFDAASYVYRRCRQVGVTPRGMIDCMIASVAHRHGATLLAQDLDRSRVAEVMQIGLDQV